MSDYTETFSKVDGNVIEAADFETEFQSIETAIATKVNVGDDITGSSASVIETGASTVLNMLVINIGDWDMVTDTVVNVAHGLTYTKIRTVAVLIRNDADTAGLDFLSFESGQTTAQYLAINATNVQLTRSSTGIFNSANYNATSYNRGWITIWYTD